MKIAQIQLPLENGEVIKCIIGGQGPRVGYIVGPGSFYLNALSHLENLYTFVTYDGLWTYRKMDSLSGKDVNSLTKEMIKKRDHQIVVALRHYFNVSSIDGLGFS